MLHSLAFIELLHDDLYVLFVRPTVCSHLFFVSFHFYFITPIMSKVQKKLLVTCCCYRLKLRGHLKVTYNFLFLFFIYHYFFFTVQTVCCRHLCSWIAYTKRRFKIEMVQFLSYYVYMSVCLCVSVCLLCAYVCARARVRARHVYASLWHKHKSAVEILEYFFIAILPLKFFIFPGKCVIFV